jgi:hypothetical protein
LTIPTGDAYLSLSKQLSVMSETERIEWAKKKGFVSLLSKQVYVFSELQSCVTTEDVYALEKKYSQYFEIISDENGEEIFTEKVQSPFYSCITNEKGEFAMSDKIYKVIGKKIASISKANYSLFTKYSEKEIISGNIEQISVIDNFIKYDKTNYGSHLDAIFTKDPRWCNNDRKVKVELKTENNITLGVVRTTHTIHGERKFGCVWGKYFTVLQYEPISFQVNYYAWVGGMGSWHTQYYSAPAYSQYSDGMSYWIESPGITGSSPAPYFIQAFFKGKSDGTGVNGWAIIDKNN